MFTKFLCDKTFADGLGAVRLRQAEETMSGTASIVAQVKSLSHQAAEELCEQVRLLRNGKTVVVDLKHIEDASTAAFARLVLLRRDLLKGGRDLRLCGLHDRAESIWRISRLSSVLPAQ